MSRRRLLTVCSSDEEDEPPPPPQHHQQPELEDIDDIIIDDIEIDFQTVTLNSANPTPSSTNSTTPNNTNHRTHLPEPIPLDISEDDEQSTANNVNSTSHSYFGVLSDSSVNGVFESLGLRLRSEWMDSCLNGLRTSVPGFQGMNDSAKAKLCFQQFLDSDMNFCGAGVLPPNVKDLHLVDIKGPFVLQVDEIVNICRPMVNLRCPERGRYQKAAPGIKRCLKLSMTDGVQRVFGMEYRPIKDLEALAPAGLKVAVCNVNIRHGLLMLVPEVIEVLGGHVEELEAARQRLVTEINKPPRGKRSRNEVLPPRATRATHAAWPPHNDAVPENIDTTTSTNTTPPQANEQGTGVGIPANERRRQPFTVPFSRNNTQLNTSSAPRPQEHNGVPRSTNGPTNTPYNIAGQGTAFGIPANDRPRQEFRVPVSSSSREARQDFGFPQHTNGPTTEVRPPARTTGQVAIPTIPANNHMHSEDVNIRVSRDYNVESNTSSAVDMDVEEIIMMDEMEQLPFVLSRDREIPFTYLASLSAKLAANEDEGYSVRGKIKCFLTGVKGFQYKQRTMYELRVYVDDGSLISEILIDHNVVRNGIGYSPQEVTSAIESSETKRVSEMKETLKQFQIFLINFEGTMLIEMNKASGVPKAVEMDQGCPSSDAWLLLKRLKSFGFVRPQNQSHSNPICLSP